MKTNPNNLPIYSIKNRKKKIDPKPQYQRGAVWSESQKQLLIDSILRGYDIPKIYLRVLEDGDPYEHEIVDGQQRLRAIWEFLDNEFPLGEDAIDYEDLPDLAGLYYKDLDSDQQDIIGGFNLSITEIRNATEGEVRELFLRLQEGKTLNPAEKRNAMIGDMRDFVSEISKHSVFKKINKPNRRQLYDDWAAHVVAIEVNNGPTDLKAKDLRKMYRYNERFDSEGVKAKKIRRILNYMDKVLKSQPPEMNIKWGFVDLFLLVSYLIDNYDIKNKHDDIESFFVNFETERRKVKDPAELISGGQSHWGRDLYNYISAFQKEGAKKANIQKRHQVYLNRFLNQNADLVPKDEKRLFNQNERMIIWRRSGEQCQSCKKTLTLEEMHADHVIPHRQGGLTTISNGQCLCPSCNLEKSDK